MPNTRQYAIAAGQPLSFDNALSYIKTKRVTLTEARAFLDDIPHASGPPCLQSIAILNHIDKGGGRNNYLFSFGVYLKKADPEFWEQKLFSINEALDEPISRDELEITVVNSLRKKDYAYKCNDAPCVDYCRKAVCKTRDYGIGKEGGYFSELEYGRLFQVKAYEPYYEWEVRLLGDEEFKRLRFQSEADIIGQDSFLRLCFRELHILPVKLKQSEWYKLINQALKELTIVGVESEDDTTPIGLLRSIFIEFLTARAMAQTRDQIANKRVYHDIKEKAYYFRTQDLIDFIFLVKNFRYYLPGQIHGILHDFNAVPFRLRTERGKQLRVYRLTEENLDKLGFIDEETFEAKFTAQEEQY